MTDLNRRGDLDLIMPLIYPEGSDVPLYVTDRIIAGFRPGVTPAQVRELAESNGCDAVACSRGVNRYRLRVRDVTRKSPIAASNAIHERQDMVFYAHPDYFAPKVPQSPPIIDDPFYHSHQWHLDGDVSKGADAGSDIDVETAWDSIHGPDAQGIPAVRVSILDECVEKLHPDLFPNWAAGLDLDPDPPDDDPSPDAGQRHGTACAGVAVAAGNNIGVRGAAPNCGLIGVKFFGATVSEMADGFYFSVDPNNDSDHSDGAAVLSNSWTFASGTLQPPDVVAAINFCTNSGRNGLGALVLFASGNNDHTVNGVSAIAQLPNVMAIGGTNSHADHTEFSDVGPEIAIATPTNDRGDDGVRFSWLNITTVDNTGSSGYNGIPENLDYTNQFGGTSSATPLAAGVLALILSQDPTMTAAQARAILQHTADRLNEPYGRFDETTGHSHRYGYGKANAGAAVSAADAGIRWPDRIRSLAAIGVGNDISLNWSLPVSDYADSLLVRSTKPFHWRPTDGTTYNVTDIVAPGVQVIYRGAAGSFVDVGAQTGGYFYAVYARSSQIRYGFGAKKHLFRNTLNIFFDNSEIADPGWTHGGQFDEWARGIPNSANSAFGQVVTGSGPLAGLNGTRAIGGNNCWGTDLVATYSPSSDAWLATPLINLTGVTVPVYLEYYDWCMLETFYDRCAVEVVDAQNQFLGYIDADTGGDYDWTLRAYDLSAYVGQPIRIRFRLLSDGIFQRDGWFIDDVRVVAGATVNLPPVAQDKYVTTTANTMVPIVLGGTDPNPGTALQFVISALPANGQLSDPNGGNINTTPYTLISGALVRYTPATDYQGPDSFTYHATDGSLNSNTALVTLSVGTPISAYSFSLSTNPNWQTEGQWAWGQPQGVGGDPLAGFTGLNVYGYNLAGQYPNSLAPQYLTMQPVNCAGLSQVTLKFARWLGVEAGSFDKATIQITTNGVDWQTVWTNTGTTIQETTWSQQSYNLAAYADNQPFVMIRWGMGPTDANTTFAGWNIDDVVIAAIGTPQVNQPPLARNLLLATAVNSPLTVNLQASDVNNDTLQYTITSLPSEGTLTEPPSTPITQVPYILSGNGSQVIYTPQIGSGGVKQFTYRASDGAISSNIATVSIDVLNPSPFPMLDDFEAGPPLAPYWQTRVNSTGRIQVTTANTPIGNYHVTLDSSAESTFALNELTLVVNLAGASNVLLRYDWKEYGDETHALPATWFDTANGDGVAISANGLNWHRIANLFPPSGDVTNYQTVTIDLDQARNAAGLSYNGTFRIRFQQYDNSPIPSDGIAIDNVALIQGTSDPQITTATLPDGQLNEPYGPVALQHVGGDPPITWKVLDVYQELPQGHSLFATVGTGQNWNGPGQDDAVFDYTLPFAFPFYGENHTQIRVAVDGWINFGAHVGSTWNNSTVLLKANKRIAVLWDDLTTLSPIGDIYIDASVSGQVTIRWLGQLEFGGQPVNFSATLFDDGSIRMDYGAGNTNLTPTIGISAGDNVRFLLANYNGATQLTNADSVIIKPQNLPLGVTLSSGGVLSGTPLKAGTFMPIFELKDAGGRIDTETIALTITAQVFGDFDGDTDVDEDDLAQFRICYTGDDGGPVTSTCAPGDSDADTDIDCLDWLAFRAAFVSSSGYIPALPITDFVQTLLDPDTDEVLRCMADMDDNALNDGRDIQPYTAAFLIAP